METKQMLEELTKVYSEFSQYLDSLDGKNFSFTNGSTWTAGQQLDHIVKSVAPINTFMKLPNFSKKLLFGKNNGNSRSSDEVINDYLKKLENGGKAPSAYVPKEILFSQKEDLISKLNYIIKKLVNSIEKLDEKDLDTFRAPHPLIGKLTIRELVYFSIYHVGHHQKSIKKLIKK